MSGETRKVCSHGRDCPLLKKDRRHGRYELAIRIDTTEVTGRQLKRAGYATKTEADAALDQVRELIKLAGADDQLRRKIGDMIFASRYGRPLPSVEDVRRKLGAGREPSAPTMTVAGGWTSGSRSGSAASTSRPTTRTARTSRTT
jgi:hypothetical protein